MIASMKCLALIRSVADVQPSASWDKKVVDHIAENLGEIATGG